MTFVKVIPGKLFLVNGLQKPKLFGVICWESFVNIPVDVMFF